MIELDNRSRGVLENERLKHIKFILDLMLSVNGGYIRRFGIPKVKEEEENNLITNEPPRDIEMAA